MKSLSQVLNESSIKDDDHLFEMATIVGARWGGENYRIAICGLISIDRPTPHVHIYLEKDISDGEVTFNFEISLIDILAKDEINLIYQMHKANKLKKTHRNDCSWAGYADVKKGLIKLLKEKPSSDKRFIGFETYLESIIYSWNNEMDCTKTIKGGNPMKEYLHESRITILPKYQKYFE